MLFKKLFLIVFLFPTLSYSNTHSIKENKEDPIVGNIPSISLGEKSNASGNGSIAIGTNSQAKNTHSVAIGTNSLATEENTVSFGNIENKHTSRLVNISDGKNNTDAVNLIQTKKLVDKNRIATNNAINQLKRTVSTDISDLKTHVNNFDNYYRKRQAEITDSIANLDKEIIALEKKVFAGIASSVAMTSIPYLSHHTLSGGIGISNYRTGTAFAGGVQYKPNNDIAFRLNSSINSEKEIIIGGGLAYGW
ncbi:TPA: hemagglutinin [Proteus mirabilis]|nr:hemagglutinin [Proteus mirabilis]